MDSSHTYQAPPILRLSYLPIHLLCLLEGRAERTVFAEITGLSPSRLRRGNKAAFRQSTEEKAIASALRRLEQRALDAGMTPEEFAAWCAAAPSAVAGKPRPFADLVYGMDAQLPLSRSIGEEIDNLLDALQLAFNANDLTSFQQRLIAFSRMSEVIQTSAQAAEKYQARHQAIETAHDWQSVSVAASDIWGDILFYFLAALDVEYGATYFKKFQPRPLFPLVFPKAHPDFDLENPGKKPRRNFLFTPTRRLLELSYALLVWSKTHRWEKKPVGRKRLAEALGLDEQSVGNLFDGTRNLSRSLYVSLWQSLCENVARRGPFDYPLPLLVAAILGQALITRHPDQKLDSFVLLDQVGYRSYWTWHRRLWASHPPDGTESWPAWLAD